MASARNIAQSPNVLVSSPNNNTRMPRIRRTSRIGSLRSGRGGVGPRGNAPAHEAHKARTLGTGARIAQPREVAAEQLEDFIVDGAQLGGGAPGNPGGRPECVAPLLGFARAPRAALPQLLHLVVDQD